MPGPYILEGKPIHGCATDVGGSPPLRLYRKGLPQTVAGAGGRGLDLAYFDVTMRRGDTKRQCGIFWAFVVAGTAVFLFPDDFDDDALGAPAVEFSVEDLLPGAEVQLALCHRDEDLVADKHVL